MSGALNNVLQSVLLTPTRSILPGVTSGTASAGTIYPDCAIEERTTDTTEITWHPVQQGATITDHAYDMPTEVALRWAWSNSSPANALSSVASVLGFGNEQYVRQVYASLLALKKSKVPFSITTPKRTYKNMLIAALTISTNEETEYGLFVEMECQQIILVSTVSATVPPQAAQAAPQQTSPTQPQGPQQPVPQTPTKTQSLLSSAATTATNYIKGY